MKLILIQIIIFFGLVTVVRAETVTRCNVKSMEKLALANLRTRIVKTMRNIAQNPIEVQPSSIFIVDQGLMIYQEEPSSGSKLEHAYSVSFESVEGTPFVATSTVRDVLCKYPNDFVFAGIAYPLCYRRPDNMVVSIPDPKINVIYDRQGNEVGRDCVLQLYAKYNRFTLFLNPNTNIVVESRLESLDGPLAVSRIE